jgi:phosphoglycolate phosphatase-like HAD superfamily hydrolase
MRKMSTQGLTVTGGGNAEAISYLEQAILSGQHWYIALLEAIGLWRAGEETYNGRHYHYLIDGEAFDWLLLAERLCEAVDSLLPEEEKTALLFHGQPPIKLSQENFKQLIGSGKYHQYLNYFYGITVEEALVLAVQEEIRKEKRTSGYKNEHNLVNEVYQRIYGDTKAPLLKRFRREKGYPRLRSISLTELKEFTYWLFKYRLKQCDKARVASDTKKALEQLNGNGFPQGLVTADSEL